MNKKYKKALILLNMGGARNKDELKMFLSNMFQDKHIINIKSKFVRYLISSFIVYKRLNIAWENYKQIDNKSPINDLTKQLVKKLEDTFEDVYIDQVMRYTPPFANECIKKLKDKGIKDIVLLPLYPQYSTTTTKSSIEDFLKVAKEEFNIQTIEEFYENSTFNDALIEEITNKNLDFEEYNLIFSAHGLPQKIINKGDPYQKQIISHVEILSKKLKDKNIKFMSTNLAYQSKIGPLKWLEPSLEEMLKNFKDKKVLIYPISFIIDNAETYFELSIEYKEIAKNLGIIDYQVCSCVNSSDKFIEFIKEIIR